VLIREDLTNEPADPTLAFVVAHEIAHQWWYNLVGNDVYDDPWLDEALASYSSSLAFEFSGNTSTTRTLINYWEQHYAKIVERGQDDRVTQSLLYFEAPDNPRAYGGIVYSKGALFFKALREKIGDEAFFRALQAYYQTYQYRIARPDDLLNTFEESSGRSLEELYNEWLYSP
jgi:aminopeptidase N